MDAAGFELLVGRPPQDDDLDRVNCELAGAIGHTMCGLCPTHAQPRFVCGCMSHEWMNAH